MAKMKTIERANEFLRFDENLGFFFNVFLVCNVLFEVVCVI